MEALKGRGIRSSMSLKGNCQDNAPTGSSGEGLKTACVHGGRFANSEHARQLVMDWIAFYNHSRLRPALAYLSPMQYKQRWMAAQHKTAA